MNAADLEQELDHAETEYALEERAAFELLLRAELHSLKRLHALEDALRTRSTEPSAGSESRAYRLISEGYQFWLDHAERRLSQLDMQERAGCKSESADEFRERLGAIRARCESRSA